MASGRWLAGGGGGFGGKVIAGLPPAIRNESQSADPFSLDGLDGVGLRPNSLYAEAALARVTPILAFPHEGGRDLSLAIRTWFRVAGLAEVVWVPAFAGMTGRNQG